MEKTWIQIEDCNIPTYHLNTIIVGSGAAGYNAADRLFQYGQQDIAMVTENVLAGTSRNTGSDKQTYYKLTLSGSDADSVEEMTKNLFDGQCVDGDHALCEAALSVQGFLRLAELGVPFPQNRYGEFVGYKTDHDPRRRATSAGPYTSRMMTELLQKSVAAKNIKVFDHMQAVKLLVDGGILRGILCIDRSAEEDTCPFVLFLCKNVIWATGGPAGIYADSVYPHGHYGASGIAFAAGVAGKNLTEWQYGIASISPRWNVSGSYMQVMPRFVSCEKDESDQREFLYDFFTGEFNVEEGASTPPPSGNPPPTRCSEVGVLPSAHADESAMLDYVFLKGYQWPFDVRKIEGGSSIIDILVYQETCKGRRVFLDFRENPGGRPIDFKLLATENREYLEQAGVCFGTPIERLMHMNQPAVEFYRDKGVDLTKEPLEISLCAQHNNGGLEVDSWWQTNIEGIFAAGEVAATHGVYRPGGSALNAGQVGATRAARYIAVRRRGVPCDELSEFSVEEGVLSSAHVDNSILEQIKQVLYLAETAISENEENASRFLTDALSHMSRFGGPIRSHRDIVQTCAEVTHLLEKFQETVRISSSKDLHKIFRLWDILVCQKVYLSAMADYVEHGGESRGSALYTDTKGKKPDQLMPDIVLDDGSRGKLVQETVYADGKCHFQWREVRPIPMEDDFFENVWRGYRENGNVT